MGDAMPPWKAPRPSAITIDSGAPSYPRSLRAGPACPLLAIGALEILDRPVLGLLCSVHLPGRIMVEAYEWAQLMKRSGAVIAGGFHSPMERQCFELMVHGRTQLIVCPPRNIATFRVPVPWRPLLASGRLLILASAANSGRRATRALAARRNRFVLDLSSALLIPHAARGSETEDLAREAVRRGTPLFTFPGPENDNLLGMGARAWGTSD